MPELKLRQLQYENDTWKRSLAFMMEENILLKNRLSEILKDRFDKFLLEEIEGFQNRSVKQDEFMDQLNKEVKEIDKFLLKEIYEDGKIIREIEKKRKNVRKNLVTAENRFSRLKLDFNHFLSENIL